MYLTIYFAAFLLAVFGRCDGYTDTDITDGTDLCYVMFDVIHLIYVLYGLGIMRCDLFF